MQRGSSQFKMQLMLWWKEISLKKFRLAAGIRTLTTPIPELVALYPIELTSQVGAGH